MTNPLITIITSVFNGDKYLEGTIESVLNQTYKNIEYIIIDGGSTDNTIAIIKKFEAQISFWQSEPDNGIYDAWNKGICQAKGDWIAFLGADDILLPNALEKYVDYLIAYPENVFDYISSQVELVSSNLSTIRIVGSAWNWKAFKKYMNVAHVGSLHHKGLYEKFGYYDINYKIAGDYEFLLRAGKNLKAGFIKNISAKMRWGGLSLRENKVFNETLKAKVVTAKRNAVVCYLEMLSYKFKFFIRNYLQ